MWRPAARGIAIVATITAIVVTSGCAGGAENKAGGETITLDFASIDGEGRDKEFADAIEKVSDGRIRVNTQWVYGDGAAEAEADLIRAIASGELDGGWPSTRAFAAADIPGLAAVEAPLVITNHEAVAALVEGDARDTILSTLEDTGVVGVGLVAGALRRPFSANAPLLGPEDWGGKRFRVYNSETQEQVVRALGAEPANLSFSWIDEVRRGSLDGAEFDVGGYWRNGYGTEAGNVTSNVVLWPKVSVLSMSERRWASLSDQQREWIAAAAEQVAAASAAVDHDEDATAALLCDAGLKFFAASPSQLDAMAAAVAPVIDALAANEVTAPVLEVVQRAAQDHPGVAEVSVPAECSTGDVVPGIELGANPVPDGTVSIPDGVYRVEITAGDVRAAGVSNGPGWSGTWTLTVEDSTYALTCQPVAAPGSDCGNVPYGQDGFTFDSVLEAGILRGDDTRVAFAYDADLHSELSGCELPCYPLPEFSFRWSISGDELQLADDGNPTPAHNYTIKPWKKIL